MMEALDTLYSFVEERQCVAAPFPRPGPGWQALTRCGSRSQEQVVSDIKRLMAEGGDELRQIEHARRRVQQWYAKLVR